jgi:hypothetical protein
MSDAPRVVLRSNRSTAEQACNARARAWAFVFKCWQAKKGEQHDLTKNLTPHTENGPRTTRQENT